MRALEVWGIPDPEGLVERMKGERSSFTWEQRVVAGQCAELGSPLQWVQSSAQVVPQVVDVLQADGQAE